jgi:hypothetical protein
MHSASNVMRGDLFLYNLVFRNETNDTDVEYIKVRAPTLNSADTNGRRNS